MIRFVDTQAIWRLVQKRIKEGWEFQSGRHLAGLRGFWACFVPNKPPDDECCPDCKEPEPGWEKCGHAMTIHTAIKRADRIAQGGPLSSLGSSDFMEKPQ